ncbi:juvenile hormone esterase-like isoform X2 [Harmonia axyridis]|nr:juvenile hormone esterase-like isoform X2 [Harmonia axyridis]
MLNSEEKSGSEDCLYLNVYTPKLPSKNKNTVTFDLKPVMVFIHGGAFTSGSNSKFIFGPDYLIREDVVIVVINYRLGFLGFSHFKDKTLGVPGNAGLKDMVLALRWVKKNIKNFNGDPENVTIFGESAGAASVHLLVLSPMAKGLFHKAIAQSGCALNIWAQMENIVPRIAKALNMEGCDERTIFNRLKELPVEDLFAIQETFPDPWDVSIIRFIGFIIEDPNQEEEAFLSEHPMDILEKGEYNHVPIMMGYNSREGMLVHVNHKKLFKQLIPQLENSVPVNLGIKKGTALSMRIANQIMEYYFGDQDPDKCDIDLSYKLWSDNFFIKDIYRSAIAQADNNTKPVYLYEMTIESSLNLFKAFAGIKSPGVCHADDLFYLFKTQLNGEIEPDSIEDKAVRRFCRLWTNFARYGNPNSPHADPLLPVTWKTFSNRSKNYLEIGEELKAMTEPLMERMQFWEDVHKYRNISKSKL